MSSESMSTRISEGVCRRLPRVGGVPARGRPRRDKGVRLLTATGRLPGECCDCRLGEACLESAAGLEDAEVVLASVAGTGGLLVGGLVEHYLGDLAGVLEVRDALCQQGARRVVAEVRR